MSPVEIARRLANEVEGLDFQAPVTHVYNPLRYAWPSHRLYLERWGRAPREILLMGMNPGPWGMVQTGVPFGEVGLVRDWLGIEAPVGKPSLEHPKRPVLGFDCHRSEVSGARLWGWAKNRFGRPEEFFHRFFVHNYCPLAFLEASGRNRTPDRLPHPEKGPLFQACDSALRAIVDHFGPLYVIGIGRFAQSRAREALRGSPIRIGRVPHPSPANPAANRGWSQAAEAALHDLEIFP